MRLAFMNDENIACRNRMLSARTDVHSAALKYDDHLGKRMLMQPRVSMMLYMNDVKRERLEECPVARCRS